MKKIMIFLFSVMLTMNCVTLSANAYMYSENEQQSFTNAHIAGDLCNFKFLLWASHGYGWAPNDGIKITVDGIDYGFVNLPFGLGNDSAEVIKPLPSGEVKLFWTGNFAPVYRFEVYNSSDELIYTRDEYLPIGLFFTYQNECSCLPVKDFEGVYIKEENQVNLSWKAPEAPSLLGFDIYRNDMLLERVAPTVIFYSDNTTELESGNYKYCVVPVYPSVCNLEDKCFETPINVGIKDYENHITIYPNPAKDELRITNYGL